MSIRWRTDGRLICASMSKPEVGDTYIDDRLHYQLSVLTQSIVADDNHKTNGLWYWVHNEKGRLRAIPEMQVI